METTQVRGRPFKPGNPGGPGRPKRETERAYLSVMMRLCPPSTWATICERAVQDALAGDDKARAFLARYLLPSGTIDAFMEVDASEATAPDAQA